MLIYFLDVRFWLIWNVHPRPPFLSNLIKVSYDNVCLCTASMVQTTLLHASESAEADT